jgi:hypothetical protein
MKETRACAWKRFMGNFRNDLSRGALQLVNGETSLILSAMVMPARLCERPERQRESTYQRCHWAKIIMWEREVVEAKLDSM